MIAAQLAVSEGVTVIGAASPRDHDLVRDLGGVPVSYGAGLAERLREISPSVDAVLDAAGKAELPDAITLAGVPAQVMTLPMSTQPGWALPSLCQHRAAHPKRSIRPCRFLPLVPSDSVASACSPWPTPPRLLENGEAHENLVLEAR
jgi:hypothetical protein